ncbi:MAG: ABC transporter ATP-binding protein [Bacteroidota bacterium]
MTTPRSPLTLDGLTVGYGQTPVLAGLDARVEPGGFVCVLGRNGSGKSTLLRTVAGLQLALAGEVRLGDDAVGPMPPAERARRIAVVLTEQAHSPGLMADDVVGLGRQPFTGWRGRLSAEDHAHIREAFALAGAAPFAGRLFDDLSDGERQRVMIARAVAQRPGLMVLDEITAFLDLPGRVEVMALLRRHARETGTVVLLSSHDLDLSLKLADAVWLLSGGALRVGPPDALIADGDVGRAFDTADVTFSAERGQFELRGGPLSSPAPHQP